MVVVTVLVLAAPVGAADSELDNFPTFLRREPRPADLPAPGWTPPDYMRKWEFGVDVANDRPLSYFADLIYPLWRRAPLDQNGLTGRADRLIFVEPRFSHSNNETLINAGIGYRQPVRNHQWLLGVNVFYDYLSGPPHYRIGGGVEAISAYAELRANYYEGISGARIVSFDGAVDRTEKVADGFDLEVGVPIPYYSRLKLFGLYELYDFEQFVDREGWRVRAEYAPWPWLVIDAGLADNNKRATGWELRAAVRPLVWADEPAKNTVSPFRLDQAMFPDSDVSGRMYDLVERRHQIVVESYEVNAGSVTVEIRRGT